MKYRVERILIAISAILLIIGVSILYMWRRAWVDDKILLAFVGGIITVYLGLIKQQVEHDAMFRSLFDSFNARYCKETNNLLEKLKDNAERKLEGEERNLVIDYFNLCAEEFLWFKKGRIPVDVWKAWKNGMLVNLEISQVKTLFVEEVSTHAKRSSYYGLAEELGFSKTRQNS